MRIIICFLFVCLLHSLHAQTHSRLIPKKGLYLFTQGLQWGVGSEVNFFTADKKHHHYYFTWWEQDADSSDAKQDILSIGSQNTAVHGTYSRLQNASITQITLNCTWNKDESGLADIIHARLWLPYFHQAKWLYRGKEISVQDLTKFHDVEIEVLSSFGHFAFRSKHPFKIKLENNPNPDKKDYTARSQYLVFYESDIEVKPKSQINRDWTIQELKPAPLYVSNYQETTIQSEPISVDKAWIPDMAAPTLLPKPISVELTNQHYMLCNGKNNNKSKEAIQLLEIIQLQWKTTASCIPNVKAKENLQLVTEGYTIEIEENGIIIEYQNKAALQHALHTTAQLVLNKNGQLLIPTGRIKDAPVTSWRGIHMFTGPESWSLHKRMYEHILLPLKMNKLVLQCEQAEWKTIPEIHNKISIPLKDLQAEFSWLREKNVEPIPLIQSLGHMEWFFKPTNYRKYAVNPSYPYTLNPEIPAARKIVRQLWKEAFSLLQPSVMHIGFDEIGMIGFHLPREKEVDFWKIQINDLNQFAKKKNAKLMLWGDMGLGPGEGPDALNGTTKERAAIIRKAIPANSLIADWHYINHPDPSVYLPNLQIWKQHKLKPIASPWLHPNNVRGFVLAAQLEKAGVLQTTWADFESSEANMLLNIEQFGAYILAMDYAWSGRKEMPNELLYDPIQEWTSRFYSQSKPIHTKAGWKLNFNLLFFDATDSLKISAPNTVSHLFEKRNISGWKIEAFTNQIVQEGTPIALIEGLLNEQVVLQKTLQYGVHLRSHQDKRVNYASIPSKDPNVVFDFLLNEVEVNQIRIKLLHKGSGLQIRDMTLIR